MGSGREFDRVRASVCACVSVCMCAMQIRVSSCSKQRCKVCRCPHAMRISFSLSRFLALTIRLYRVRVCTAQSHATTLPQQERRRPWRQWSDVCAYTRWTLCAEKFVASRALQDHFKEVVARRIRHIRRIHPTHRILRTRDASTACRSRLCRVTPRHDSSLDSADRVCVSATASGATVCSGANSLRVGRLHCLGRLDHRGRLDCLNCLDYRGHAYSQADQLDASRRSGEATPGLASHVGRHPSY